MRGGIKKIMKVLFAVSEAYPFVKSGGLGDVGGSLPQALQTEGTEVRVIIPKYTVIPEEYLRQMHRVTEFEVNLAWRRISCSIDRLEHQGIVYYFIGNDYYFNRESLYGYHDEGERFAFFSKAVLESLVYLNYQADVIHCHDWHTAIIPLMLKENFGNNPYYFGIKTILTIHNLKYQGYVPQIYFDDVLGFGGHRVAWEKLEYGDSLNYLKAGILSADLITTVSPTYAQEIQQPSFGESLDSFLRKRKGDLYGILNGIDTVKYDPQRDPHLLINYRSSLAKKGENKKHLQGLMNLPSQGDWPLIAIVSRLVEHKGLDLVVHILDELLNMNVQMVVLGTGDQRFKEIFQHFAKQYPQKLAIRLFYDEALAHKIYGGADLLLMPSQSEPCGLSQMIAMRYGTLPIVRETGGLRDTVTPFNEASVEGNGFSFVNYNAHDLLFTVQKAVKLFFEDKTTWQGLVKNARNSDFSWGKSARQYRDLYQSILNKRI